MRLKDHRRLLEAAVLAEREECARIADEWLAEAVRSDGPEGAANAFGIAKSIRARTAPIKGYIRPETAENHPEKLQQGYRIAGQGLSADGERIIGNGRGSEHPCQPH